ncbi:MAG: precorrin-6A reductase [Defluviitaleaceae bacterium]|nr:precorrin-6A reductase [Defluviitaleaceae bacterium]
MSRAVIFGGTAEGRKLCEACAENAVEIVYCVATNDGARPVESLPRVDIRVGRLNAAGMTSLIEQWEPALAIDATHPYAADASANIAAACGQTGVPLTRVRRESAEEPGCVYFSGASALLAWLEQEPGNVFVSTGSSLAAAFAKLPDYQSRVWMRVLPSLDSLRACLDLGYLPGHLICMQGPFSEELNRAMFKAADARILVTKDTGAPGGFSEKARAARGLGMAIAVLSKPEEADGVSLEEALGIIMELSI